MSCGDDGLISVLWYFTTVHVPIDPFVSYIAYHIARKFREVKFSWKLIQLSFCDFIFTDSDPIAIINDVNIVSLIKIFAG